MNKTTALAQNPSEAPQKDLLPGKKRSGSIRDTQSDSHNDEADKAQQSHLPLKTTSQFDCSNLGLFFGARSTQAKTSTAELFAGKAPCQKKTSEGSTTKEGNSQKQPSSKDFSNLEELVEDTTIIPNPDETGVEVKKKPIEVAVETKVQADEAHSELVQATSPENALSNAIKKKSIAKFFPSLKGLKEEKPEQDLAGDISKIGFNMDDEQEKPGLTSYTDINASRNNLKVLEVIKKKAVPSRYGAFNPNIYENPRLPEGGQTELRTNNNSVFAGAIARPLPKAVNPFLLQYQDIDNDGNQDQEKFIAQLFGNTKKNGNSGDIPLDKTKEICHADLNPRLLTEKTAPRNTNFVPTSAREHRIKPNVSLVSTDSTVDSEGLVQQNNSFSTPYSVANGSFNNSVKLDGSSPMKMDSGRMLSDNSGHYRGYSMQGNMNMVNQGMSMMNSHRMSAANLNQSCISFLGYSGTNSDHSANMSFNGDDFLSNYNTPQAGQQQQFRGQSFSMPSNSHMMEQQIFMGQPMTEPTTYRSNTDNNFAMMNQSPQNSKYQQERKPYTPNDKNGTKMRRKNQDRDDDHLYQIDLDKLETNGRTTVMIRNIPNKYDLTLILQTIEKNHKGKFDFFYLPIDFSNKCNFGYAFINFSSPLFIKDFYNEFNGKKWEKFNSEKICEIKYGRIQGQEALMQHFQYSRVMNQQDKKLRPYVPTKYGLPNKQKIEELVRQQKLDMSSMKI